MRGAEKDPRCSLTRLSHLRIANRGREIDLLSRAAPFEFLLANLTSIVTSVVVQRFPSNVSSNGRDTDVRRMPRHVSDAFVPDDSTRE